MTRENTVSDVSNGERTSAPTRRRFLKGTAAAGVTAAGVGTAATSTSAQLGGGSPQVVAVSEGSGWFGGGGWSADGSFPVADELLVFVHGWFGNTNVDGQTSDVLSGLEAGGYVPDESVGIEWPATNFDANDAASDTEDVGDVVAGLAEDFYDAGGGNVRLVGHSMGCRCVFWTLVKLGGTYEIDLAVSLAPAASGPELCGDPWNPGLDSVCELRNYYSANDSVVGGEGPLDTMLGVEGANCDPGPNFTDIDVTDAIGDHLAYLGNETVGADIADAIAAGPCDAGGTGGSGSSGGESGSGESGGWGGWGSSGNSGSSGGSSGGLWGSGGSSGSSDGSDSGGLGWF